MKTSKKLIAIIAIIIAVMTVMTVIVMSANETETKTVKFCGRKLTNVPDWLNVEEPKDGLATGATASGLLAIRARDYIAEHRETKSFEIKEVVWGQEKAFLTYKATSYCFESEDNGGAGLCVFQPLLDDRIADVAKTVKRSHGNEKEIEVIYKSLSDRNQKTYAWHLFFTRGKKSNLHFAPMTNQYWSAWTRDGVMLQANYGGFVYIAGREDPVCVTANGMVESNDLWALSHNIAEAHEPRYAVYGGGIVAHENPETGQLEICPWYTDEVEWAGNDYYPKLFNGDGRFQFVFMPNEKIPSKYGGHNVKYGESILAKKDGFALVEYNEWRSRWYARCQVTGAGFSIPIYGNGEFNLVATEVGVFVVYPTGISLVKGVSTIKTRDDVSIYDETNFKKLTTGWLPRLEATTNICEEVKAGNLLGHEVKNILKFDEKHQVKTSAAKINDVHTEKTDDMEYDVVEIIDDGITITWSTFEY